MKTYYHKFWFWYHTRLINKSQTIRGMVWHINRAEYHEGELEKLKGIKS